MRLTDANCELKAYCKDFHSIRRELKHLGARPLGKQNQEDLYFYLPGSRQTRRGIRRMKLQVREKNETLIFYEDRRARSSHSVELVHLDFPTRRLGPLLIAALGVRSIVRKQREIWSIGHTVFHLDKVKGIGNIFEIEIRGKQSQLNQMRKELSKYRTRFLPYIRKELRISNEDLVRSAK